MLNLLKKKLNYLKLKNIVNNASNKEKPKKSGYQDTPLSSSLKENEALLQEIWGLNSDIIFRPLNIGSGWHTRALIIFVDGMVDSTTINQSIIKPLLYDIQLANAKVILDSPDFMIIKKSLLAVGEVNILKNIREVLDGCLNGNTILLLDGCSKAFSISSKGWEARNIEEPKTQPVVRGPHEGFNENIRANVVLVRRRVKDPDLVVENLTLGKRTRTTVALMYIKDIVNPPLLKEVKKRLGSIDTDIILESGYIEQFIEDAPLSPFSTIANTERPDSAASKILEGRIAIFVDGTPSVLTVPMLFIEGFQAAEDYYSRPFYVSVVRSLRYISFLTSVFLPGFYVAVSSFHHNFIPTPLLLSMAEAREGTPFPALVEALIMGVIFEILREAGIRLPRTVGNAISIVGALVIGESAVSAGLIGAPMVIVVSLTAIVSFVVPTHADVGALLRVIALILAGTLGAFGLLLVFLGVLIHLASLRSFGTPYLSPLAPLSSGALKDVFVRAPLWAMDTRPSSITYSRSRRTGPGMMPYPPKEKAKGKGGAK